MAEKITFAKRRTIEIVIREKTVKPERTEQDAIGRIIDTFESAGYDMVSLEAIDG